MKHLCLAIAAAILMNACASTDPAKDKALVTSDLDVKLDRPLTPTRADLNAARTVVDPLMIEPNTIIAWQQFFKKPPNRNERTQIAARLAKWPETKDANSLLVKARHELALGRVRSAEVTCSEAIRIDAKNREANLEMVNIYLRQNKADAAFDFLAETKRLMSKEEEVPTGFIFRYRYLLALAHNARGEYRQGHDILSNLIALNRDFTPAYRAMASSYLSQNKVAIAEFVAKRGIDRAEKDPGLLNILGVAALQRGNNNEARKWFDEAITLASSFSPALVNRANQSMQRSEYEAAENDLKNAVDASPDNVEAYIAQGLLYRKTGRYRAAQEALNAALDLNPDNAIARLNLGILYAENLNDQNKAVRLFKEVAQISNVPSPIKNLAQSYMGSIREKKIDP